MTNDTPEPPALGVKVNVASTPALPATRSAVATLNVTEVTAPPITPLLVGSEGVASTLVCTVTFPAGLAAPNVQPASVTVTAFPAVSAVSVTAKTMEVVPGVSGTKVVFVDDEVAEGVGDVAKKPDG